MKCNFWKIRAIPLGVLTFVLLGSHSLAHAESLMYIDESGNILFADSVGQVPERYRNQVIKQPVFSGDAKAKKAWLEEIAKRRQEDEVKRQQKEDQLRRDEEAKKRQAEVERKQREQQKQGFFDRAKTSPKVGHAPPPVLVEIPKE